jgi:hypothetical protein
MPQIYIIIIIIITGRGMRGCRRFPALPLPCLLRTTLHYAPLPLLRQAYISSVVRGVGLSFLHQAYRWLSRPAPAPRLPLPGRRAQPPAAVLVCARGHPRGWRLSGRRGAQPRHRARAGRRRRRAGRRTGDRCRRRHCPRAVCLCAASARNRSRFDGLFEEAQVAALHAYAPRVPDAPCCWPAGAARHGSRGRAIHTARGLPRRVGQRGQERRRRVGQGDGVAGRAGVAAAARNQRAGVSGPVWKVREGG